MCYYFDDIIKIEDFDLDNIIIDEKSYENIENIENFIQKFMMELNIQYYLEVKNKISFATGLDILSVKCDIMCVISHSYAKTKVD